MTVLPFPADTRNRSKKRAACYALRPIPLRFVALPAGWAVVVQRNGLRRSIPIFRKSPAQTIKSEPWR